MRIVHYCIEQSLLRHRCVTSFQNALFCHRHKQSSGLIHCISNFKPGEIVNIYTAQRYMTLSSSCGIPESTHKHPLNHAFSLTPCFRRKKLLTSQTHHIFSSFRNEHSKASSNSEPKKEEILEIKENVWTIPNFLTLSRIALTPVLGYCVLQESFSIACGIFVFAGMTDLLDGWIARNFASQMSSFGSYMDPLADKLLVSTLFITLTVGGLIPVPLTLLVITRDIGLICAAFYVRFISLPKPRTLSRYFDASKATAQMQPLFISKVNTALQLSLVALTLASPVFSFVDHPALQALWYITAGTTVVSGISYMFAKDTFKIFKKVTDR